MVQHGIVNVIRPDVTHNVKQPLSEETYRQQLAAGSDPESLLKPGEEVTVNGKARVTMYLDADIVEFFKKRAPHYQTEINAALRQIVDSGKYAQELISDEVVEKLAGRLAQTLKSDAPLGRGE